jgi:hypothetical protein
MPGGLSYQGAFVSDYIIPASRKRILLAIYLDYLVLSPFLILGLYLTTGQFDLPTWQEMLTFLIYEALLYRLTDSPGFCLLSIRKAGRSMHPQGQLPVAVDTLLVDSQVYFHEHWQTILIGLLFVVEGSKQMVRWAMWTPPLPVFGIATTQASFAVYSMVLGGMLMYTGYMFLRLKRVGFWLGLGIATSTAVSTVMSWKQWDGIARELLIRRRAFQGLPVRSEEVEFLQVILPEALVAFLLLTVAILFFVRQKLRY